MSENPISLNEYFHRNLVNIRVNKALEKTDSMPRKKRKEIKTKISRYQRTQIKLRHLFESSKVCENCQKNYCCHSTQPLELDFIILKIANEDIFWNLRIHPEYREGKCSFQLKDGCSFPKNLRPKVCVAYLCSSAESKLTEESFSTFQKLRFLVVEQFNDINYAINCIDERRSDN